MPYMRFRALNSTLKTVILEASKNIKVIIFLILTSYKYHNDNITHIYSSIFSIYMSITCISMIQILPCMMSLKLLVKILLQVMDLNMNYKIQSTPKNTRNSDFLKIREIRFWCFISCSSTPYALFSLSTYSRIIFFRPQQPQHTLYSHTHIYPHHIQRNERNDTQY